MASEDTYSSVPCSKGFHLPQREIRVAENDTIGQSRQNSALHLCRVTVTLNEVSQAAGSDLSADRTDLQFPNKQFMCQD